MSWRKIKHPSGSFSTPLHCFNSSCSVSSLNIFWSGFLFCFSVFAFLVIFLARLFDHNPNLDDFSDWIYLDLCPVSRTVSCLSEVNGTKRPWNNQKRNQKWLRYSTPCFCANERGTVRISVAVTGHGWCDGSEGAAWRVDWLTAASLPLWWLVSHSWRAWALDGEAGPLPSCSCAGRVTTATWAPSLSLGYLGQLLLMQHATGE